MTASQYLAALALLSGMAGAALVGTLYTLAQRTRGRVRRWVYSPRRNVRVSFTRHQGRMERLAAMDRHPAGSRR